MSKIIYYVASSLDGYISGPQDDVSQFVFEGAGVDRYQADLLTFQTVIMGRRTYEFGYQFGLVPGQPAYPHMEHYIFSNSMQLDELAPSVHIVQPTLEQVSAIKAGASTDIYLCGGGQFAGWLLEHNLIDQLKVKLNPIILGDGIRLFGNSKYPQSWQLTEAQGYDDGLQIITYERKA